MTAQPVDSLAHYLRMAAENNPGIKADLLAYRAALQKLSQAGAYPDPQLEVGFFLRPMDIVGGQEVSQFKLIQMFPWFGTKRAAHTQAMHRAQQAFQQFSAAGDNLRLEVCTAWYRLCNLQQQIGYNRQSKALLDELEALATRKLATGQRMSDVLRIQLETATVDDRIERLLSERRAELAAFNALLNRPADAEVRLPDSLTQRPFVLDEASAGRDIERRSPRLAQLAEEELAYRAGRALDRKRGYPTLGVGMQYMLNRKTHNPNFAMGKMNGDDMLMPMFSVSLPLYRNKYKAQQRESLLLEQAARQRYDNLHNALLAELYKARQQLDDAARQVALCQKQERLTETIYRLALQEFAADRNDLTNLIAVERQLLDYRVKKAEAIARYNTTVAEINKLTSEDTESKLTNSPPPGRRGAPYGAGW
jgi:outer membrane protein TolC